ARRRTHPPAPTLTHALEAGRPHHAATQRQVRRLLGGRAARTPHRGPLAAILAALGWHASLRRLDDCRRGTNVRVSANAERQDQVPDARGVLLADGPIVRVRLGCLYAEHEAVPEDGPVDSRVQ